MSARHTLCRYCPLEIEGLSPYRKGEWRDRGNNTRCNDGKNDHAPERRKHQINGYGGLDRRGQV